MKKIFAILAISALFAACGQSTTSTVDTTKTDSVKTDTVKVDSAKVDTVAKCATKCPAQKR
jgi:ABC-type glycerol-3-phosphate transport system substrate-binding protein